MDDYRHLLKGTYVIPIGNLLDEESTYQDDQIVSVAGIVQSYKMKTTRNNSTMAYVTVEDDTAAIEMLAFSNVLSQFGGYLGENSAIVVTGRLSLRDDKDPQIVINRVTPIQEFASYQVPEKPKIHTGTLYLRLPGQEDKRYGKVKAILNMFPGDQPVVLYFADTAQRRGTRCQLPDVMLKELTEVLGKENVVLK